MPRLVKGGKWVYGWVVVGPGLTLSIPPAAWCKYGFQAGGEALLLRGSRTSGGFGLADAARLSARLATRVLGRARFDKEAQASVAYRRTWRSRVTGCWRCSAVGTPWASWPEGRSTRQPWNMRRLRFLNEHCLNGKIAIKETKHGYPG